MFNNLTGLSERSLYRIMETLEIIVVLSLLGIATINIMIMWNGIRLWKSIKKITSYSVQADLDDGLSDILLPFDFNSNEDTCHEKLPSELEFDLDSVFGSICDKNLKNITIQDNKPQSADNTEKKVKKLTPTATYQPLKMTPTETIKLKKEDRVVAECK